MLRLGHKAGSGRRFILGLIAGWLLLTMAASAHAGWYSGFWTYRKKLTIDSTLVQADLTDFPVLVSLTTDSDISSHALTNGDDILFTSADGTTKLNHEIEVYTDSTGELIAHVKVPSVLSTTDTEIYVYYGYGSATNQENAAGVWSDYVAVYHLDGSGGATDSSGNGHTGTNSGTASASGQIGDARDFESGDPDYIGIADSTLINTMANVTLRSYSLWFKAESMPATDSKYVLYEEGGGTHGFNMYLDDSNGTTTLKSGQWNNSNGAWLSTSFSDTNNQHHLSFLFDSSGSQKMILDGSEVTGSYVNPIPSHTGDINIGRSDGSLDYHDGQLSSTFNFDGIIDELRIANTMFSSAWAKTEYNNHNNPGTGSGKFIKTLGTEEVNSSPAYDQASFRGRDDDGDETGASWLALENYTWIPTLDQNFRVRYLIQEKNSTAEADKTFQLEYKLNTGSWTDVTGASSVVRATASPNVIDGIDTTQQLGSGTFVDPNAGFDEANGQVGGTAMDFSGDDEVEVEYCVQLRSTDVSNGDTVELRIKGLDAYTTTTSLAVVIDGWYNYGWVYRKKLTIDGTKVFGTSNHTNFPVLVSLTSDSDLAADARSDFYDVLFTAADGSTRLDHEIESFNATNGDIVAWVRIPSLPPSLNTEIYMYYGYGNASDQQNVTGVWTNYVAVYHLDGSGNATDSTGNGHTGTDYGTSATSGQNNGARDFQPNDYIEVADSNSINTMTVNNRSYSVWFKAETMPALNSKYVLYKEGGNTHGFNMYLDDSNGTTTLKCGQWRDGNNGAWISTSFSDTNGYHHLGFTFDSAGSQKLILDGSEDATGTFSQNIPSHTGDIDIGESDTQLDYHDADNDTNSYNFDGIIDEFRIANTTFSKEWMQTEYGNAGNPGSGTGKFIKTLGIEEWRTFNKYRKITVDASEVAADLTNFPLMVTLTGSEFQVIEDDITDADGDDLIFRESKWGDQLRHEIEVYDTSNDILVAWVKVPSLSGSSDTDIFMWYGNQALAESTQDVTGVWSSSFEAVHHLHESSGTHYDATSNDNDSTAETVTQQGADIGQIDGADEFDGTDDLVALTNEITFDDNYTLTLWMEPGAVVHPRSILGKIDTVNLLGVLNATTITIVDNTGGQFNFVVPTISSGNPYHLAITKDSSDNWRCYLNGTESSTGAISDTDTLQITTIGQGYTGNNYAYDGILDEVHVASSARTSNWIQTEYNNQSTPDTFYTLGPELAATAVSLISFTAQGQDSAVSVEWQTAREFDNVGFHIYRANSPAGPYERLTDKLISARPRQGQGANYSYLDTDVKVGSLYYYKLEDIDVYGKHTEHGPICVDWDADGLPDDWEIIHGLNPWVNDADLDYDNDGLSNYQEYQRGLDPFNADSDGDGTGDGDEDGRISRQQDDPGSKSISRGVEVIAADETGMTLALTTSGFEAEVVTAGGQEFEQLKIADYVHGYTSDVGAPRLPLKGLMINVPADKAAQLTVVDGEVEPFSGYRIYPVPQPVLDTLNGMAAVGAAFVQNESAYSTEGFYPQQVADLGQNYIFGDQLKQQVRFYPIGFNPTSGELLLYRKIVLRIDYVDARYAKVSQPLPMPWQPPQNSAGLLSSVAVGFAAAPMLTSPISPILSSLGAAVAAYWSPPDALDGDVYKIVTDAQGIYHISKDYLETNGVDTDSIDLSDLRIYYLGEEIAIEVFDQNSDDHFDGTDYIRFYAQPLSSAYAKYSGQNVYWLTLAGGSFVPLRMGSIEAAPAGGIAAADFADIARAQQDVVYWLKAPGTDGIERWFYNTYVQGDEHGGGGAPVPFTISVPDPVSSGSLTILMVGQTDTQHEVDVVVNGVQQSFSWTGISYFQAGIDDVPLFEGDNTVSLQCLSADGNDSIIVDWFEVAYQRDYVVGADNIFKFAPDSGDRYLIDGFSSNTLVGYDISDPVDVAIIENALVSGNNPYSFEFEPTAYGDTYLVLASEAGRVPVGLFEDTAADLAHNPSGADYILITHRDLGWAQNGDAYEWLQDLAALRQAQGLRVAVVDIEDIYDEFSFGIKSPQALKDFLAYAYSNWPQPAPQYVLLVGDSTYDPKDHWGAADDTAYLPTYLMFTDFKGETVSDQWFVTFAGNDALADMHIGRLPAANSAQATTMVDKIIAYESAVNARTWTNNLLLVADNQRPGSAYAYEAVFETINEDAAAQLPEAMASPVKGYLNDYAASAFLTNEIIDTINDGVLMVNYAGHGATQIMAEEHIFDASDVAALTNTDKLAFFVSMSCETGFFAYPEVWFFPSLAEVLMRSEAGAVAALMPTGMTSTEGQQVLDAAVFEAIFKKDIRTLGAAIAEAKQTLLANGDSYFEQISDTFMLFGDPATALQLPLPHIPANISATRQEQQVTIGWDAALDCNQNPVNGYNIYRAASAAGPFSKINTQLVTDTFFVDGQTAVGIAAAGSGAAGSYYGVSAVDDAGLESSQSMAVSPASIGSSGATAADAVGCFIGTAGQSAAFSLTFNALVIIVSIMFGFWLLQTIFKPQNNKHTTEKKMNPFSELKNVKTLLVDDDEFIRNSLELAFKTKGCFLQVAETAEQGLQAIKNQQFDIIISDLRLPGINGLDFLKLTTVTQPQAVKFLITAYRDDHIFSEAIRIGVTEFIEKPFAVKVLINLLALAVKRQTRRKAAAGI